MEILKPRMILPLVGVTLLSLAVVACSGAPDTSLVSAESDSTPTQPAGDSQDDIDTILRNPHVESLRQGVVSMGPDWVLAIARWKKTTAEVTESVTRRSSPYLFNPNNEGSIGLGTKYPGESIEFTDTAEVYLDKRQRRDRWAIHPREKPPREDQIFLAIKFRGDTLATIPVGVIPHEYWRVDGPGQATRVDISELMSAQ